MGQGSPPLLWEKACNPDTALPNSSRTFSHINPNPHARSNVTSDQSGYINRV